jgi:hypothetical protein
MRHRALAWVLTCLAPGLACGSSSGGSTADAGGDASDGRAEAGREGGKDGATDGSRHDAGPPPTADFFVSPAGADAPGCGSLASPCETVAYVQPLVQKLVATSPKRTVTAMLRGNAGAFWLTTPLSFGTADSGTATTPVLWTAYPGESPVLSAGAPVTGAWTSKPQAGSVVWTTTLPASTVDFGQLFIDGKRHYAPRATTTNASGYLTNVGPVCVAASDPTYSATTCKMVDKGPARCAPTTPYECYDRFTFSPGDVSASWKNITVGKTHPIVVDDFEDWTVPKLRLASVVGNIAYLTGPTEMESQFHGFIPGHRYVVENVADDLTDQDGNYYVDESVTPWTLSYFTKAGDDPNKESVVYPQAPSILVTTSPLSYVTFQGLTFSHDDWTVPAVGYPSVQAEPMLPAAVSFVDASHVTIDGCTLAHTGAHGLEIVGSGKMMGTGSNTVENSAFYDVGGGGVRIGLPTGHYTDAYETGGNTFVNNVVDGTGRVVPGSELVFVGNSDDNTIEHNEIYDGYGDGISVCVPSGGSGCTEYNNQFRYNHVHHIKQGVTSDGGGIYIYSNNLAHVSTPNVIANNWVHDVNGAPPPDGYGGEGIYLDNNSTHVTVENNLVYRASAQSMFVNYGYGHTITNNVFAFGREGVIGRGNQVDATGTLPEPAFVASKNIFLWDQNTTTTGQYPDGLTAFPQALISWDCFGAACTDQFQFVSNLYWNPTPKVVPMFLVVPGAKAAKATAVPFTGTGSWQTTYGEDKGASFTDPLFKDSTCGKDDYSFAMTTAATAIGFVPFDYQSAGRTKPVVMPPALDPGFPLQVPANPCSPTFY